MTCTCNSLSLWCDLRKVRQLLKKSKTEEENLKLHCQSLNVGNQRLRVEYLKLRRTLRNYQGRYDVAQRKMDLLPSSLLNPASKSLPYLPPIRTSSLPTSLQSVCLSGSWLGLDVYSEVQDAVNQEGAEHAVPLKSDELELSEIGRSDVR